jgi:quinohemoprotein ethanol dehydrogenase
MLLKNYLRDKACYLFLIANCILISCAQEKKNPPGWIDEQRLLNADGDPGNWMSLGRNFMQQHHSTLKQINTENVKDLGFAWDYETNSNRGRVYRGLEATPIVVDGVLYTSGAWSQVYALDAKTGKEIWRYDPQVDGNYARRACCDVVNRGVQVWKGKVYVGTLDGFLVCLDAATGKIIWRADSFIDRKKFYTITSAPQIAKDKVVIGNSGGEFDARGYITAYDLETGKFSWRFFTVPGDPKKGFEHPEMEMASKTWDPNSTWENGGGGTVWGQMAYDPELNLLYIGTGNSVPYPIWFRSPAGGDNLFLVSILAINPDNGRMAWYYQTTPGEIWDYTCTSNIVLADLMIENKPRKVLMQAPKNGFFYVIDRANGELISARNFVPVNWATHIDMKTGTPVLTEQGWYKEEPKFIFPFMAGGHNWPPMSYSTQTGLVYIPTLDAGFVYTAPASYQYKPGYDNSNIIYDYTPEMARQHEQQKKLWPKKEGNILKAWDPVLQKEVWRVKMTDELGGVLSTNGKLVFNGTSSGKLIVYHAETGKKLKEINTGTGIIAAPMSYEIDGEQYIAVMAGYGGAILPFPDKGSAIIKYKNIGRIIVFKLNGAVTSLPPSQLRDTIVPEPPSIQLNKTSLTKGKELFFMLCNACHMNFGETHLSDYPDLSMMSKPIHESFNDILLKGKLSHYGMANFSDVLKPVDVEAIHQYLISVQKERFEKKRGNSKKQ